MIAKKLFLAGRWVDSGRTLDVRSPWDGARVASVATADEEHLDEAAREASIAASRKAPAPHARAEILIRISAELQGRGDEVARQLAAEAGKPLRDARREVDRAAATFAASAEEARRVGGEMIPLDAFPSGAGKVGIARRFPIGPVLGISPFNFPLNLVSHKVAPAIAAGCPIVLKPASATPLSALLLAEIAERAGLPKGMLSVVPCERRLGDRLVEDDRFRVLTFTGSPDVGWALRARAGRKRVVLELGGNAAVIVHDDAELLRAADRIVAGAFGYAGQSCISVQRVFAHERIEPELRAAVLERTRRLKLGDPLAEDTDVGPMIDEGQAERAASWIEEAAEGGAKVLCGGERQGALLAPTVLADTRAEMKVRKKEVFAPIATITPYARFEEALEEVNNSEFGLQAGVFTRDFARIWRAFETLEVGGVIVNEVPTWRADHMPYGGVKSSGAGREGPRWAIEDYTELRLLAVHL
jgi:glyceraldehyde-3-phosphate dehydrogenase (NADP+)